VVQETMRRLQANVPGIAGDDDTECIHQARVALRRLRSTQKAFAALPLGDAWELIITESQWLATVLGRARDLDVFLSETLSGIEASLPQGTDLAPLKAAMHTRRDQCRQEVRTALSSARYGALLLRLLAWLNQPPATTEEKPAKLREFAGHALDKRRQTVERLARNWETLNPEQRHALRKRAKKLRYAAEFFSPLYKHKPVARYLEHLQGLQQILGEMNDSVAAQALLAQFAQEDATLAHGAGLITGWLAHAAKQSEARLARALKRQEKTPAFW